MLKATLTTVAAASLVSVAVPSAQAAILVDYDDGLANGVHDVAVRNGGFESRRRPSMAFHSNTDNWQNLSGADCKCSTNQY